MRTVKFTIEKMPKINYARNEVIKELRDIYAQPLIRQCYKKLGSLEIKNISDLKNYIILIFNKSLELELSTKELEKLESMRSKFPFLHYHETKTDNLIHRFLYLFVALCNKHKKVVESLVSRWPVLDSKGNTLSLRSDLDWEYSKALRDDVANLTRECIRDFLQEIRDTGRVMTSAELAENQQASTMYALREIIHTDTDTEAEVTTDRDSGSSSSTTDQANKETSSKEGTTSQSQESQQRASLNLENDANANKESEADNKTKDNSNPNILLAHLFAWIYQLPEWLQEQILNSIPIRTLIEITEQTYSAYEIQSIFNYFTKSNSINSNKDSVYQTEDNINKKVTISFSSDDNLVDTSMVLDEPEVSGWILPTMNIGSENLLGSVGINELADYNGLNGIRIF